MLAPKDQTIENFGMYFEQYGMPRILGRIYGLLMITNEAMLGLDQMAEQLSISKASASTTVRQLQGFTLIEKVTVPGDRKDYYRVSPDAHVQYLKNSVEGSARFAKLIENAAHLTDLSPSVRLKLERLEHLYEAFNAVVQDFFANYNFEQTSIPSKPKKGKR